MLSVINFFVSWLRWLFLTFHFPLLQCPSLNPLACWEHPSTSFIKGAVTFFSPSTHITLSFTVLTQNHILLPVVIILIRWLNHNINHIYDSFSFLHNFSYDVCNVIKATYYQLWCQKSICKVSSILDSRIFNSVLA